MRTTRFPALAAAVTIALALPLAARAQDLPPSPAVAYQGRLLEAGQPVTGPRAFTFTILDAAGNALWSSGATTLSVANGLYAVTLGAPPTAEIPVSVLSRADLRLRVQVGAKVLSPDLDLVPALQARSAFQVTGAFGGDVQGTQDATVVMALQGKPVDLLSSPPAAGQALVYDGSRWVARTQAGPAGPSGPPGPPGPAGAAGGVASVGATLPLSSSGGANPVLSLAGAVPVASGGTGSTTASGALGALGAAPAASPTFTGNVTASNVQGPAGGSLTLGAGSQGNVHLNPGSDGGRVIAGGAVAADHGLTAASGIRATGSDATPALDVAMPGDASSPYVRFLDAGTSAVRGSVLWSANAAEGLKLGAGDGASGRAQITLGGDDGGGDLSLSPGSEGRVTVGSWDTGADLLVKGNGHFWTLSVGQSDAGGATVLHGGGGTLPVLELRRAMGGGRNPYVAFWEGGATQPSGGIETLAPGPGVVFHGLDRIVPSAGESQDLVLQGTLVPDVAGFRTIGTAELPFAQGFVHAKPRELVDGDTVTAADLGALLYARRSLGIQLDPPDGETQQIGFRFTVANAARAGTDTAGPVRITAGDAVFVSEASATTLESCVLARESVSLTFVKAGSSLWIVQGNAQGCD